MNERTPLYSSETMRNDTLYNFPEGISLITVTQKTCSYCELWLIWRESIFTISISSVVVIYERAASLLRFEALFGIGSVLMLWFLRIVINWFDDRFDQIFSKPFLTIKTDMKYVANVAISTLSQSQSHLITTKNCVRLINISII